MCIIVNVTSNVVQLQLNIILIQWSVIDLKNINKIYRLKKNKYILSMIPAMHELKKNKYILSMIPVMYGLTVKKSEKYRSDPEKSIRTTVTSGGYPPPQIKQPLENADLISRNWFLLH